MANSKAKPNFQGKDSFCRMNFLFQASMLMAGRNQVLSAYYGNLCKNIGKKSVLRIDPEIKRFLCKKCSLVQRPGITSNISVASKPESQSLITNVDKNTSIIVSCNKCGHTRRFKVDPNLNFWLEKPESVAEATRLSTKKSESVNPNSTFNKKQESVTAS